MKFILTNSITREEQSVTKETIMRVKGQYWTNQIIKIATESGISQENHFENEYDLKVTSKKG